MSKTEFFEEFKILCDYYKDSTYQNKRITALYYKQVKYMTLKEFRNKCEEIMTKSKFMPKIADFANKSIYKGRQYTEEYLEQFYDN